VRRGFLQAQTQKPPQAEAVRDAAGDPALRVNPFEVSYPNAAEIDPRRKGRAAHDRGVILAAELLHFEIELGPLQDLIEPAIEGVGSVSLEMAGVHPQGVLPGLALAERHARIAGLRHSVVRMFQRSTPL